MITNYLFSRVITGVKNFSNQFVRSFTRSVKGRGFKKIPVFVLFSQIYIILERKE
jgi:hypothetical protein